MTARSLDLSNVPSPHPVGNRVARVIWRVVWGLLYRTSPKPFYAWRRVLLRLFGAKVGRGVHPHNSVRIWAPWNLTLGDHSALAPFVDCYSVTQITIGAHATVSQYSYLCAATHDISDPHLRLVVAPIRIGDGAWVCADSFIGPGVTIGDGAVVGARSSVFRDVEPWTVVAGNPAKFLKKREINSRVDISADPHA